MARLPPLLRQKDAPPSVPAKTGTAGMAASSTDVDHGRTETVGVLGDLPLANRQLR